MPSIKELAKKPEKLSPGHRLCAGCGASIVVRQVLSVVDDPVVAVCATGCLEVATTIFPYTAWNIPFMHSAFENSAATASGLEAAYVALSKKGKIKGPMRFAAFGGDGGTYDIGLQALSGMLERGHHVVYICYDNGAYMNTGIQRSSATPFCASTTTAPAGKVKQGKEQFRKDITAIAAAHNIPYAAQASINRWPDLTRKAQKAFAADGPAFLNVLAPCPRGWRFAEDKTVDMAKLAVDTGVWPLFEIENGKLSISYKPKEFKPVTEWLSAQGRFRHVMKPGNEHLVEVMQKRIHRDWKRLEALAAADL